MFATVEADFGLFMLREAPANEPLVVSPLSVIFALAMLQAGARVTTKNQINKVISKGESDDDIVAYYSNLSQQILKAKDGVDTKIANGFFLDNQYEIEDHYKDMVTKYYSAKVESYDFGKPDESAEIIDNFVSNVTEGKVRGMVKPNNVKGAFALIVNAIYFTAEWSVKFDQSSNSKRTFFSAENSEKELGFMNKVDYKLYAEDVDLQVLSLQYKDTSYAFNILLPKKRFGLGEVLKTIDGEKVQHLLSKLKETYVSYELFIIINKNNRRPLRPHTENKNCLPPGGMNVINTQHIISMTCHRSGDCRQYGKKLTRKEMVTIPKMKIESDYKLKEALIMMGVTDMFNDSADLTGIAKSPPLRVSKALHRAIIEVDEDGTTAAAATVIGIEGGSFTSAKPVDFIADHPFIFILTNDRNPLFIGQFV